MPEPRNGPQPPGEAAPQPPRTAHATEPLIPEQLIPEPAVAAVPAVQTPHRAGLATTLVLGSLTALAPLSMDMYLPALPEVAGSLHSSTSQIQLTLTSCLAGIALGQLVVGPLSDALGRRRPLLAGLALYVLATAACAVAPGTASLVAFRLVQGLAGAAGIVIARAVVRDLYSGLHIARFYSTLMLVTGVAPVAAPLLGAQLLSITAWRGIFVALTAIGLVLTGAVALWLKETLPPERRQPGGFFATLRTMRGLVRDVPFTGYVLTSGFTYGALFAYISGSPFVVQEVFGASPQVFSVLFGANAVGLVLLGQLNGRVLVGRVPLDAVLGLSLGGLWLSAAALTALVGGVFGEVGLVPVAAALFALMSLMGLALPNTTALALGRTPHAAGSASALLGTVPFLIGSVIAPLVGLRGEGTALPMAVVMLASTTLSLVFFAVLCRPWRTSQQPQKQQR